ncbi:hypothetical protein D3C86_1443060 [compost metagenome]
MQVLPGVPGGVAIEIVERHHHRNHAVHGRQLAPGDALTDFGQLPQHVGPSPGAGVETPDLAVIGAQVGEQQMQALLPISREGALVVAPEWRTQQGRRRSGDRGNIGAAVAERLLQCRPVQRAMIAVPGRGGVQAQNVAFSLFALHDFAPQLAAAGP